MSKFLRALLAVSLAAVVLVLFSGRMTPKGKPFRFEAQDLDGNIVTSDDSAFAGKVLVVDIWGTWCPPCRAEIPHLNDIYETYKDRGVEVVGVAFENTPDRESAVSLLRSFAGDFNIRYRLLYGGYPDVAQVRRAFPALKGFGGYPTTAVIDREGKLREMTVGFSSDVPARLIAAIEQCL